MCVCEWPCDCATVAFCTPKQMQTEQRGYCSLFENLWQLQQQHPTQWHTHVLLKQRLHKYSTSLWCVAHTHTLQVCAPEHRALLFMYYEVRSIRFTSTSKRATAWRICFGIGTRSDAFIIIAWRNACCHPKNRMAKVHAWWVRSY